MLTSMCWVPSGSCQPVPHKAHTTKDEMAELRKKMEAAVLGDEEGVDGEGPTEEGEEAFEDVSSDGGSVDDCFVGNGGVLNEVESDSSEEMEDVAIKPTDLIMLCTRADEEEPRVEMYVYDDPEDNLYLHHDMPLTAFPLCTTWATCGGKNIACVGTMLPHIELWDCDILDPIEASVVLGGCKNPQNNYRRKIKRDLLLPDSHKDAVLALEWNSQANHILASCSADATLKIWDMVAAQCLGTYVEDAKVQSASFNPHEANLLLSGNMDGMVMVRDCRAPQQEALKWQMLNGEATEKVSWDPASAAHFFVSSSGGHMAALDVRMGNSLEKTGPKKTLVPKALWTIRPHPAETTFAFSRHCVGLLATGGKDGKITLHDARASGTSATPREIVTNTLGVGSVFSMGFTPNHPYTLGACGSEGKPLVYSTENDVREIFRH